MRRSAWARLILAAAATPALLLGGCGGSSHHSGSATTGGSPTASASSSAPGSASSSSTVSSSTVASGTASATSSTTGTSSTAAGPPPAGARLTVSPADGHPSSTLRFTLLAPSAAGRHGQVDLSYALSIAGRQGPGCVAQHAGAVPVRHAGVPETVAVGPAQLGGRWCVGSYAARVEELARPVCSQGEVCPQFIRMVAVIGPVRFRIMP